jgi:hypothetical protein
MGLTRGINGTRYSPDTGLQKWLERANVKRRADEAGVASILSGLCMDCSVDTLAAGEYYALKDQLWRRINPLVIGMLCLSCVEDRLGRSLWSGDFARAPVNAVSAQSCPSLARRLKRAKPASLERSPQRMTEVKPRLARITEKSATQSRLGLASFQLMARVGRSGRVRPSDIMSVACAIGTQSPTYERISSHRLKRGRVSRGV